MRNGRGWTRWIIPTVATMILVACLVLLLSTWNRPQGFYFLPGGDVALGFHSHRRWLGWAEFAWWMDDPWHVTARVPWAIPIVLLLAAVIWAFRNARRS